MISGNMADVLSNIYLGYSLVWYHTHGITGKDDLKNLCLNYLNHETEYKMNHIIENYPINALRPFLFPLKNRVNYSNLEEKNKMYSVIKDDINIYNVLKEDIYDENTILEKMEMFRKMDKTHPEYDKLYQDIIRVGEFNIEK